MYRKIVAGNWKMNLGNQEGIALVQSLLSLADGLVKSELWLAPPAIILREAARQCVDHKLLIGAQNLHWENSGAFTGEISASMVQDARCSFAIVGHSERRTHFGETDETIAKRMRAGLQGGLKIIACIGEHLEDRQQDRTHEVLSQQLLLLLQDREVLLAHPHSLLVAYEPVWAIGTGKVATIAEIADAHAFIRRTILTSLPDLHIPLLYGGSVKPENFGEISSLDDVDGALVGGASLSKDSIEKLCAVLEG
jgi:triosephosphate isomerase (TIM)